MSPDTSCLQPENFAHAPVSRLGDNDLSQLGPVTKSARPGPGPYSRGKQHLIEIDESI
jgi:hypothetical protein